MSQQAIMMIAAIAAAILAIMGGAGITMLSLAAIALIGGYMGLDCLLNEGESK